jgi:hypothetical protein
MTFDDTNTFSLNKNDKQGNERRPDYKGKVNIEGRIFWLSGWIRQGANGSFISGPIELAEDKYQSQPAGVGAGSASADDDVPF